MQGKQVPPTVLATNYLKKEWEKETKQKGTKPPLDLQSAVIAVVMQCGYRKETIDTILTGYLKNK